MKKIKEICESKDLLENKYQDQLNTSLKNNEDLKKKCSLLEQEIQ